MSNPSRPYQFASVGAGWRTEFFLRIARAMPERFELMGLVVRSPEKGQALEERWHLPTFRTPDALLEALVPEFWVGSVSYAANFEVNQALVRTGIPLLTETPPAATLDEMRSLWELVQETGAQVQVCEQFHRQPHHAARIAAVAEGWIGEAHTAYVSLCHGYHGTSLIRQSLCTGFDAARIIGMGWKDRLLDPGGREGRPAAPEVKEMAQQTALLDFDGKQAVFDFAGGQYFSPIRAQRVAIRGTHGEIVDHALHGYSEAGDPITLPFERRVAGANGNLEGFHLKGIQLGDRWLYRNSTAPARLSDEEIAMADMLGRMGEYVRGGPEFYPLADGMQDHYLGLCIRQACETGEPVVAKREVWAGS